MRDDHDHDTHTDYSDTYSYGIVYVDIFHVRVENSILQHGCCNVNVHKLYDHNDKHNH